MVEVHQSGRSHVVGMDLATRVYIYIIKRYVHSISMYFKYILHRILDRLLLLTYVRNNNLSDISRIVTTHIPRVHTILDISTIVRYVTPSQCIHSIEGGHHSHI